MKHIISSIITIITFPIFALWVLIRNHAFGICSTIATIVIFIINVKDRPEKFLSWEWLLDVAVPISFMLAVFSFGVGMIYAIEEAIGENIDFIGDTYLRNVNKSIFGKEYRNRKLTVDYYIKKCKKEPLYKISFK